MDFTNTDYIFFRTKVNVESRGRDVTWPRLGFLFLQFVTLFQLKSSSVKVIGRTLITPGSDMTDTISSGVTGDLKSTRL